MSKRAIMLAMAFLLAISIAFSIPEQINLQGKLTNAAGTPLQGIYNFTFNFYNESAGGVSEFNYTASVTTDSRGIYDIVIKGINFTFDKAYYLGVKVGNDDEMSPRINISSAPYAIRSNISDDLAPDNAYVVRTINITENLYATENISVGSKISFRLGQMIDNLVSGWLKITGSVNVTGSIKAAGNITADYFIGDGSMITGMSVDIDNASIIRDYNVSWLVAKLDNGTIVRNYGKIGNTTEEIWGVIDNETFARLTGFSGENITSGIVADARIAAAIARDSEIASLIENDSLIRDYNVSWLVAKLDNGTIIRSYDKLGNTTAEIRQQFTGSNNISVSAGQISLNLTCEQITGSADLCDGDDAYSGGWTDDGSVVRLTTAEDDVGIGSAAPDTKLYVSGNGTFTSDLILGGNLLASGASSDTIGVDVGWTDDGTTVRLATATDNVGIGTIIANEKLTVAGNASVNNTFYVTEDGKVGIGTSSPGFKLHVVGDLNVSENISLGGGIIKYNTSSKKYIYYNGSAWQEFGTGSSGSSGGGLGLWVNGTYWTYLNTSYNQNVNISDIIYVNASSGMVGIGTDSPSEKLNVSGNIGVSGNVSADYFKGDGSLLDGINDNVSINYGYNGSDMVPFKVSSDGSLQIDVTSLNGNDLICTDCIGAEEISDVYVLNTGDVVSGDLWVDGSLNASALNVSGLITAGSLNITGTSYLGSMTLHGGNITASVGTFSTLNVTGVSYLGSMTLQGGNITADYLIGDGSLLANLDIDNLTIIRSYNESWLVKVLENATIVRNYDKLGNTTAEIWSVVDNETFIRLTGFNAENITGGTLDNARLSLDDNTVPDDLTIVSTKTINTTGGLNVTGGAYISGMAVVGSLNVSGTAYLGSMTLQGGNITASIGTFSTLNVTGVSYLGSMTLQGGNITASLGIFTTLNVTGAAYLGNVTIESGNITPVANNTYSLGSPSLWWKDLYLANGSLYIAGTALSASASGVLMWNGTAISNVAVQTGNNTVLGGAADEKVGIGTNTPSHKLEVAGAMNVSDLNVSNNLRVAGDLTVVGTSNLGSITISADNITVNNVVSKDGNISFYNSSGSEKVRITNDGNVGVGTTAPGQRLHVIGNINISNNVFYGGNLTGYGADFAERFTKAEEVYAGDVVCLNEDMEIEKCSERAQISVIGVVSENPTIIGNGAQQNSVPVGIVGIVKTKAKGNIERFDLLTTSSKPGYAEKASKEDFGAIIGKAMEPCYKNECMIKVLVTLS